MNKNVAITAIVLAILFIVISGFNVRAKVRFQVTSTNATIPGTPTSTPTPTDTPLPSPTTTLVPLPALTLIYPVPTATDTPTITPVPVSATKTSEPADDAVISALSPRLKLLIVIIAILWVFLAVFAVIYIRQFR